MKQVKVKVLMITTYILFLLIVYSSFEYDSLNIKYKFLNTKYKVLDNLIETNSNYPKYSEEIKEKIVAKAIETYEMCSSVLKKAQFGITGIYYHDKYYCVWTKDRTEWEINRTSAHERCHDFIYLDEKQHFCKEKNY